MQVDRTKENLNAESLQNCFERDVKKWEKGSFERCVLNYSLDQMNVTISLLKSYDIYFKQTMKIVPSQIRISPNNEKIQAQFNKFFKQSEKDESFIFQNPSISKNLFELRYFNNRLDLLYDEMEVNKRDEPLKKVPLPFCFLF